ncbi:hypothetical protein A2U01_0032552, partial [Trifolium medium]|nr:hypothetical protein [Trifolium medium]
MPTNEEKELPKSLGSNAEPDASKDPTNRLSSDIRGLSQTKKNDSPLSDIAEEVSLDKVVRTIVQELTQEHKQQDSDKIPSPQNAGEYRSNSKQPSPPKTYETPQAIVDQDDQEKPVHTSLDEPKVVMKQDEHQVDPEVPVQGDDQVLEDVNAVANNNDIKADGGGDQPLDGEHSTT